MNDRSAPLRIVIVGGGFGGLYAARALSGEAVEVTLIDTRTGSSPLITEYNPKRIEEDAGARLTLSRPDRDTPR
jgi:NADH dehydrogenase FAD-containing subunit